MSGDAAFRAISALLVSGAAALFVGLRWGAPAGALAFVLLFAVSLALVLVPVVRRRRIGAAPFPAAMRDVLTREVGYYRRLGETERARFEREVAIFLAEQHISGKRGVVVDDELRVLVAASAVILVFGRPGFRYPHTRDIVIYDESFSTDYVEGGDHANVLGMVHGSGPILFSSRALRQGFADDHDGMNVGLHELAHVLDFDAGQADGVPALMPWGAVRPWTHVMHAEMARAGTRGSVLRQYAATNEAELFAVATEVFFERPRQLRAKHPELYALLYETFGQDPAAAEPT